MTSITDSEYIEQSIKKISRGSNSLTIADEIKSEIIPIELIHPNKKQPRKYFNEDRLNELALSILNQGIIQPVVVLKTKQGTYQILAGERRWRAAQKAGYCEIPCIVRTGGDYLDALRMALVENTQREDLTVWEEAVAYKAIMEEHGWTQEQLAEDQGKKRSWIAKMLSITRLCEDVINMIIKYPDDISVSKFALLPVLNPLDQVQMATNILMHNWSVKKLNGEIKRIKESYDGIAPIKDNKNDSDIKYLERNISETICQSSSIKFNPNNEHVNFQVQFHSLESFMQFLEQYKMFKPEEY